jgi:DNA-binding IclR family transcriptional regulator
VTGTAAPIVGLTLAELAARLGRSPQTAAALVEPFLAAGLVQEDGDGVLVVVDAEIRAAFAQERPTR